MNAFTYYRELIDWLLSHVTETEMFLLQSAVTCGALVWYVPSSTCREIPSINTHARNTGFSIEHG